MKVVIEPKIHDFGVTKHGDQRSAAFTVRNLSAQAVRIIGTGSDCTCLATNGLPTEIAPYASKVLRVTIDVEGSPDEAIDRAVTYYSDAFPLGSATVHIVGRLSKE